MSNGREAVTRGCVSHGAPIPDPRDPRPYLWVSQARYWQCLGGWWLEAWPLWVGGVPGRSKAASRLHRGSVPPLSLFDDQSQPPFSTWTWLDNTRQKETQRVGRKNPWAPRQLMPFGALVLRPTVAVVDRVRAKWQTNQQSQRMDLPDGHEPVQVGAGGGTEHPGPYHPKPWQRWAVCW